MNHWIEKLLNLLNRQESCILTPRTKRHSLSYTVTKMCWLITSLYIHWIDLCTYILCIVVSKWFFTESRRAMWILCDPHIGFPETASVQLHWKQNRVHLSSLKTLALDRFWNCFWSNFFASIIIVWVTYWIINYSYPIVQNHGQSTNLCICLIFNGNS